MEVDPQVADSIRRTWGSERMVASLELGILQVQLHISDRVRSGEIGADTADGIYGEVGIAIVEAENVEDYIRLLGEIQIPARTSTATR